ncbi:chorismate mutase [Niveispirillum irakense]|uniref:chorismate mutase n=1 Tax=Niveispirillum irakense TaxID=34011 RepID=UPI0004064436|nr:chorismate mutase [Niveispirillum irakense]
MSPTPTLDDLRREIDEIDVAIHKLLMRRTEVVQEVAKVKPAGRPSIRPGREAEIIRALVTRHDGLFPVPALVRIWREMVAALTRIQGPLAVAVVCPDDQRSALWDNARDHFGSSTPAFAVNTPMAAMRAVSDGNAVLAVVPWPEEEDQDAWWRFLVSPDPKTPRIIARLPFLRYTGQQVGREGGDALVLAAVPMEATGDDRTLLAVEFTQDISRGRLKDVLEAVGFTTLQLRTHHLPGGAGAVHLVEVVDFVPSDDPRLAAVAAKLGDNAVRVLPIGAYATPIMLTRP